ncbi:MAG: GspE/PulE family protein [Campylobacterota bacterium]|nr:GspE/PulE family protein [Campylobacterota bacterium]
MGVEKKLSDILLERQNCTPDDIAQVESIQKEYGGTLHSILLNLGVISDSLLTEALAQQYSLKLFKENTHPKLLSRIDINIPMDFLQINNVFPIYENELEIGFVTHDPMKADVFLVIKNIIDKNLVIYLATEEEIREVKNYYETIEDGIEDYFEDEVDRLKELASEAPVIKLVNNIFTKAAQQNVSDIHFEAYKLGIKVRYRIDGALKTVDTVSQNIKQAVTARLKLISKMNISENRLPQDGRISIKLSGQDIDIRASSVPTAFGESFVLRFLGSESVDLTLDNMDFYAPNLDLLKSILKKPNGILLTTGPTGSGKTSTLYAALNHINNENIKIITVEDPVEYQLDGISQIQVKSSIDYTFANALRSILRQDPDIIMVGEIRDHETAEIAIQSALTGHFVLSTLHTNSAVGAITRLLDMNIEYFLLKSSIVGLMAQRLVRKLCEACKEPTVISKSHSDLYNIDTLKDLISSPYNPCKAVGCKVCNFTGYSGRLPVMEIVPFDEKLMSKLDNNKDFSDIRSLGYLTLQDIGIIKFVEGKTSLEEVIRLA